VAEQGPAALAEQLAKAPTAQSTSSLRAKTRNRLMSTWRWTGRAVRLRPTSST
jgi:hypothetical protein